MHQDTWHSRRQRDRQLAALWRGRPAACEPLEQRLLMAVSAGKDSAGVLHVSEGAATDSATITATSLSGTNFTVSGTGLLPTGFASVTGISVSGPAPILASSVTFNTAAAADFISLPGSIGVQFVAAVNFVSPSEPIFAASTLVNVGSVTLNTLGVTTASQQVYAGPVTLNADTTLKSTSSGTIALAQPVNGAHALTIDTTGSSELAAAGTTTPLTSVTVLGGGHLSIGNITTSGTQVYNGPVTLLANSTVAATSGSAPIKFLGTVDGAFSLTANAQAVQFAAPIGGNSALTSIATSPATHTVMSASHVTTTGAQIWAGPITLPVIDGTFTSTTSGNITFGQIDGAFSLAANTGGTTTFTLPVGSVTPLTTLTTGAGGTVTLNGGIIVTKGTQSFQDPVTLGADATLTSTQAGNISFGQTVNGAHALAVNTGGITSFASAVGSVAHLSKLTTDAAGSTALPNNVVTTGDQTYNDAVTLPLGAGLASTSGGNISFAKVDGPGSLIVDTSGTTLFNGLVGADTPPALIRVLADGSTTFNTSLVRSSGEQTYENPVTLASDAALSAGNPGIHFEKTIDGPFGLTLTAATATLDAALGSITPLASFTNNSLHTQFSGSAITTAGVQNFVGSLSLALTGNATFRSTSNGNITFASSVDAATPSEFAGLTVDTGGTTTFGGPIGATLPPEFLTTDAPGMTVIATPTVTTVEAQTYADAVRVGSDTALTNFTLSSSPIQFSSTLDGPRTLSLGANNVNFLGPVGGITPLGSLNITRGLTTLSGGSVVTAGNQTYAALTLNADSALSSVGAGPNDITFSGVVRGAHALTIAAGTGNISFNSAVGVGAALTTLTIASANNVSATGAITAGSITQISGLGATNFIRPVEATDPAGITVAGHDFSLGGVTLDKGSFTLSNTGSATVSGVIAAPNGGLTKTGPGMLSVTTNNYSGPTTVTGGTLVFVANQSLPGGLHIGAGASAVLNTGVATIGKAGNGSITTSSVTFDGAPAAPQGRLDLRDNKLTIQFGNTADPVTDVRQELASGFHGGDWAGQGIVSSVAASNPSQFALGFADGIDSLVPMLAPGNILVKFSRSGDANLDGMVGFSDLITVARHYGQASAFWDDGDFNYDGKVGFDDLIAVARDYGSSLATASAPLTAAQSIPQQRRAPAVRR